MYLAMSGMGVALALLAANWCFVLLAAAVGVGFAVRVPREERMMLEIFGDQYRAHMDNTGRFLPKVRSSPARKTARQRADRSEER
jgi:protein-S-isoprenylcysteine O-methyltransferase Ste14